MAEYPLRRAWAPARFALSHLPTGHAARPVSGFPGRQRAVRPGAQGLVEYGLILALTAVLTVVILTVFGGALAEVLDLIADAIEEST